jgi:hypothetical protein
MNKIATLLMTAGLVLSSASFAAGGAYTTHESTYEPAYIKSLSNSSALGGRSAATAPIAHESTYDPAHLRALSDTPAGRSTGGRVIAHESIYEPGYLRGITGDTMQPARTADGPLRTSSVSCPQHESTFDACHLKSLQG